MTPAKKAVQTRQENAKKRSNAARKAWRTRRKNDAARKRSEVASKAWKTRKGK